MSSITTDQIKATGSAQVIVVLEAPPPPPPTGNIATAAGAVALENTANISPSLAGLDGYFVKQGSQNSALAMAGLTNVARTRPRRAGARARRPDDAPRVQHFPNLGVMLGTVTREGLRGLKNDDRVKKVVGAPPFSLIRPVKTASAALSTNITWGIKFLRVPKLWDQGLTGNGVIVGHLDTGADGQHPSLKTAFSAFAELNSFGEQVNPVPSPHDTDDHGTHTAATIAGRRVQNRAVGVAPGAKLASAIVIEGGNVIARILGGMDWAVSQNVRILNMSLGLRGFFDDFLDITRILRSRNILPVFAVGNEGPETSRSPGNYAEAISIGANDNQGRVADFSSSQRFVRPGDPLVPDFCAPGVDVVSARPGGGFQMMSGTSMATPHIAGLAALLFEAKPTATASDVEKVLFQSCVQGNTEPERGNRGFPDAVKALNALVGINVGGPTKGTKKSAKKSSKKSTKSSKKKSVKKKTAKKR
jgi:subtilisin family serine protease